MWACTWHSALVEPEYRLQCWLRLDGVWAPTSDANHTAGYLRPNPPTPNVWAASLAHLGVTSVPGLRLNNKRLVRARFPNADPETDGFEPQAIGFDQRAGRRQRHLRRADRHGRDTAGSAEHVLRQPGHCCCCAAAAVDAH